MAFYYMCIYKENYMDYCLSLFLGNLHAPKIYNQTTDKRGGRGIQSLVEELLLGLLLPEWEHFELFLNYNWR